jgi:UrcA family protein
MAQTAYVNTSGRRLFVLAMIPTALTAFAALPAAADNLDLPQVTVKYSDLDVSRPQGAAVLYSRIRIAAA